MHFTLTKCSAGVKIKNPESERGCFGLAVYTSSPGQRQEPRLRDRITAASNRRPEETRQDQRQQSGLRSRILLPLPKTRRNLPRSRAATTPSEAGFCCLCSRKETLQGQSQLSRLRKQDFAASAIEPMKLTGQRQQPCLKRILLLCRRRKNSPRSKAANHGYERGCCL